MPVTEPKLADSSSQSVRSVVITGTSTGIGRACALDLVGRGYRVFAGVRNQADGNALVGESRGLPGSLVPLLLDVAQPEQIASAAQQVKSALGADGIAGLVNNAGIVVPGPLEFVDIQELRRQFEINTFGPIAVTQAFFELIRKGRGRVVMISSMNSYFVMPFMGPYCASKAAMNALSDAMRLELRPWGIEVAIVQPGAIATPIWGKKPDTSNVPDQLTARYGDRLGRFEQAAADAGKRGIPAHRVADTVRHALEARRPRTRYKVGADTLVGAVLSRLPDRLQAAIFDRVMPAASFSG